MTHVRTVTVAAAVCMVAVAGAWFVTHRIPTTAGAEGPPDSPAANTVASAAPAPAQPAQLAGMPAQDPVTDDMVWRLPDRSRARFLDQASAYALTLLSDGDITGAEYMQAARASYDCTVAATAALGVIVVQEPTREQPSYGFSSTSYSAFQEAKGYYNECHKEYLFDVATAWGFEASMNQLLPIWAKMAQCLADRGAVVAPDAEWIELQAAAEQVGGPRVLDACSAAATN